jgi:hypothetical protein
MKKVEYIRLKILMANSYSNHRLSLSILSRESANFWVTVVVAAHRVSPYN